jgi:hypothetical protein
MGAANRLPVSGGAASGSEIPPEIVGPRFTSPIFASRRNPSQEFLSFRRKAWTGLPRAHRQRTSSICGDLDKLTPDAHTCALRGERAAHQ